MISYVSTVVSTKFHWRQLSIKKCVGLAVLGIQTRFISLACDILDEQVHADVIMEHIVHREVQGHPTLGVQA